MKWVRRIGISLGAAFFGIACGAVLLFNWSALGFKALSVPTGSMRPAIPPGSLVLMHRVPVYTIKDGDVITYANPLSVSKTITHRVIKSYKIDGKVPAFITKGDANSSVDPVAVVGGQVLGKAVWHTPHVGAWLSWSKTWVGLAVLVYLPALIIMIEEVKRLSSYYRSMQPYTLPGYGRVEATHKLAFAKISAAVLIIVGLVVAIPAQALLRSNTVALVNNRLTVAAKPPSSRCTNNNSVNVSNSSTQTSSSGNTDSSNNNNGGSATSGAASNSNSTSINVNVNNTCP